MTSLGVCSPLRRPTLGRVPLWDAGLDFRAGDSTTAGAPNGRHSASRGETELARSVLELEGRGFRAGVPGLLALQERDWGDTLDRRDEINRGHRRGEPGRRAVGEEVGETPGPGPRVSLWTRRAPRSLGPPRLPFRSRCQALQAALSPPPRAFSPVRSRARAARGAGRRRREQPVV